MKYVYCYLYKFIMVLQNYINYLIKAYVFVFFYLFLEILYIVHCALCIFFCIFAS